MDVVLIPRSVMPGPHNLKRTNTKNSHHIGFALARQSFQPSTISIFCGPAFHYWRSGRAGLMVSAGVASPQPVRRGLWRSSSFPSRSRWTICRRCLSEQYSPLTAHGRVGIDNLSPHWRRRWWRARIEQIRRFSQRASRLQILGKFRVSLCRRQPAAFSAVDRRPPVARSVSHSWRKGGRLCTVSPRGSAHVCRC